MIKLQYDTPTAGVRVSFVIRDGAAGSNIGPIPSDGFEIDEPCARGFPETLENLLWIRKLLNHVIKEVDPPL